MKDYFEAGELVWGIAGMTFIILGITYLSVFPPIEKIALGLIVGFFVPLGVYSFNQVTDYREDLVNKKNSVVLSGRKSCEQILAFSFLCKALAIVFSFFISWAALVLVSVIVLTSFLYSYRFGFGRLKEVPLVKNVSISVAWSILPLIPAFSVNIPFDPNFLFIALFVFMHCFISSLIADLQDMEGDQKSGIKTLPLMVGIDKTVQILVASNVVAFFAVILGMLFFNVKTYLAIMALIVTLGCQYAVMAIGKKTMKYIYDYIDKPVYASIGVLALLGRLIGL